ncbi:MAG TPA: formylmethanofuran dehydrogenase subunit C [Pirellulales bacterium]|nr:formylmethanofuran dehydrogenase subunit C [Pirellulales bacterium]
MRVAAPTESAEARLGSTTPLTFTLKEQPAVPLEAEMLSPDVLAKLSLGEIAACPIYVGKRRCRLDDFFSIAGEPSEHIELHGDLRQVKWIGRKMTFGRITVHGGVGMHLGAHMRAGAIEVHGDAGDWIGAEMTGGFIRIHGNAGGQVGAAYRGSLAGMRGGAIIVDGASGLEVGMRMRRGTIVLGGPSKDFTGLQMKGGTIVLLRGAEIRTGAWMMRGTILSLVPLKLLPTFAFDCSQNPVFLNIYARRLREWGVSLPHAVDKGRYDCYTGDASVPGKGEILIWQPC